MLLRLKPVDQRTMITRVKALAPAIQARGAALLLDGNVELVARSGADGAHLTGIAAMEDALSSLKPDRIAGVGGLATRHDSMSAGEAGADYVLFGEPDAKGQRPSVEAIAERLQWWAELFEPPCVGFAASREEAHEFAAAGADFVLVGDFIWTDSRGPAAALAEVQRAGDPAGLIEPPSGKADGRAGIAPEMKILRSISMLAGVTMLAASAAAAQMSLAPPGVAATPDAGGEQACREAESQAARGRQGSRQEAGCRDAEAGSDARARPRR